MRRPESRFFCRIMIGAFLLSTALPLYAGIYFWTDENGVRHYSNVAPSDTGSDVQQLDEIPPDKAESPVPADIGTGMSEPAASGVRAPAEGYSPASPETEKKPAVKDNPEPETAAPPPKVPTQQDKIVESERAAVRNLQRQLDQDASRREEIIEKERERLAGALEQLQKTPLSEFGSQKNKTRAMGYYKYRLEALQDSPDRYFSYGESDID